MLINYFTAIDIIISVMATDKWNSLKQNYSNIFKNKYVIELLIFFLFFFLASPDGEI